MSGASSLGVLGIVLVGLGLIVLFWLSGGIVGTFLGAVGASAALSELGSALAVFGVLFIIVAVALAAFGRD